MKLDKLMKILKNDSNFFESNNLFILAFDDNSILRENLGETFMGYPLKNLGIYKDWARRLKENSLYCNDGFQTNDDEQNKLYKFYHDRIKDIRNFF